MDLEGIDAITSTKLTLDLPNLSPCVIIFLRANDSFWTVCFLDRNERDADVCHWDLDHDHRMRHIQPRTDSREVI